jgi:hypothetical protein
MSSRRRPRRRRHHPHHRSRRIGKKMSSFRRHRVPPPQDAVRIRRGCNKSHLFLFSLSLSLSLCVSFRVAVINYFTRENTKKKRIVCGKFYLFIVVMCLPPTKPLHWSFFFGRFCVSSHTD